ncbi:MAG: hypothetical protein OCD76_11600 [Reichenbachiella sp.]
MRDWITLTNPIIAEIVAQPAHYWSSSSRDYAGKKGLLTVEMIE